MASTIIKTERRERIIKNKIMVLLSRCCNFTLDYLNGMYNYVKSSSSSSSSKRGIPNGVVSNGLYTPNQIMIPR